MKKSVFDFQNSTEVLYHQKSFQINEDNLAASLFVTAIRVTFGWHLYILQDFNNSIGEN